MLSVILYEMNYKQCEKFMINKQNKNTHADNNKRPRGQIAYLTTMTIL